MSENASVSEKIVAARARRIATAPASFRKLLAQSYTGKCSPRAAIKGQCAECNGFDRQAIADSYTLWHFRPFKQIATTSDASNPT